MLETLDQAGPGQGIGTLPVEGLVDRGSKCSTFWVLREHPEGAESRKWRLTSPDDVKHL